MTAAAPDFAAGVPRRVLFIVTEDWYFYSHRLPIARALKQAGYEVAVACRVRHHGADIQAEGFRLFPLALSRRSLNPFHLALTVRRLRRILREWQPDVVHNVALKPALLGSLAARREKVPGIVNAIAGLGFVFSSARLKARLLRPLLTRALRWALRTGWVIVQNDDDAGVLAGLGIARRERIAVIRGSGVDLARFKPAPEPPGPVVAVMVSRMIEEKGVRDLVAAAKILKAWGADVRVRLAGAPDAENPSAIPRAELLAWDAEGTVQYLGPVRDVPGLWAQSHIGVLPSFYAEGVPLSLIEAAAAGRALVACDRPGLRDIAVEGESGLLVPPHAPEKLAGALARLAADPTLRAKLGRGARRLAEERFSEAQVVAETLAVYGKIAGAGS